MRTSGILWALFGLLYAAGAGWLLYDFYDESAALLRGRWLKDLGVIQSLWPGIERVVPVSWLHDLRIVAIPVYVALGLWLAEKLWARLQRFRAPKGTS